MKLLRAILFLALAIQAFAANWYVDNAASGSNNGTSWANAWTSFSAITWGGAGVKAGDTLYISGGTSTKSYGTSTLTIGASGSAGNLITVSVGQDAGHTGEVTWDFDSAGDNATTQMAISFSGRTYVKITGLVGADPATAARNFVVKNLRNTTNNTTAYAISNTGSGGTGVIIEGIHSINCGNPIRVTSSTGWEVRYCTFEGVRGDAAISAAASTGTFDASKIHHNSVEIFYNTTQGPAAFAYGGPDAFQVGSGVSIYNNYLKTVHTNLITSTQHPDMVQAQGNYVKIYNNQVDGVGDSFIDFDRFSAGPLNDVWIYNNVFDAMTDNTIDVLPEFFRLYSSSAAITSITRLWIEHNLINSRGYNFSPFRINNYRGNPTASDVRIRDNIFLEVPTSNSSPLIQMDASTGFASTDWDITENVIYRSGGLSNVYIQIDGTNQLVSAWQAGGMVVYSSVPSFVNYSTRDWHLTAGDSVARDKATLSSAVTTDYDGVARPYSTYADIGPFEYASVVDTTPPTPNPSTIASYSILGTTSFSVTATTSTDAGSPPVLYRFSSDNGATWTAYQSSATYTFTGLTANTTYQVKVQARDSAGTPNVTTASSATSVVTDAAASTNVRSGARRALSGRGF